MSEITLNIGGVPEHFNLPWHMALDENAFDQLGVKVNYREFPGGTGALTKSLREKDLDVAIVLFEGAVADILNGGANRIVKTYVDSPLIWGIHVASQSPFKSIDDIDGKRYAISRFGSGSHLIAIVDASMRGWQTVPDQFVPVGGLEGAREALSNGDAEIFFWERAMTQPYVDNGEFRRVAQREVPWPSFVVSVRQEILDSHSDKLKQVLMEVEKQCNRLRNDNDAVEKIAKRFELELEDAASWFSQVRWCHDFDCPVDSLKFIIKSLNELKIVDRPDARPDDVWQELGRANLCP